MKKNLIALAVAGAVAAPLAAQADATIYGVMDVEVASFSNVADVPPPSVDTSNSALAVMGRNNRIGFKGVEDLGNGMKAIWQVETDLDNKTNKIGSNNGWATRNTFVGLAGNFGAVILGKHDTPYKIIGRKVDLFGHHLGDSRGIIDIGNDARVDNVIAYKTPNMAGFGILAAYVTSDSAQKDNPATPNLGEDKGSAYSINATYNKGPLFVGAAIQHLDENYSVLQTKIGGPGVANGGADAWRIAASYKFAAFKVTGMYSDEKVKQLAAPNDLKFKSYGIGGSWTSGAHTVKAQWYTNETDTGATTKPKADMIAVGYDYGLSKKTTLYAEYVSINNKDGATATHYGATFQAGTDSAGNVKDPSALGVGLRVKF